MVKLLNDKMKDGLVVLLCTNLVHNIREKKKANPPANQPLYANWFSKTGIISLNFKRTLYRMFSLRN